MNLLQSLTKAVSGTHSEGHVGEALDLVSVLWQEALWLEFLGLWPVPRVVMEAPDREVYQVTRLQDQVGAGNSKNIGSCQRIEAVTKTGTVVTTLQSSFILTSRKKMYSQLQN